MEWVEINNTSATQEGMTANPSGVKMKSEDES